MAVVAGDLRSPPQQLSGPTIPAPRTMSDLPRARAIADLTLAATSTAVNVAAMFLDHTLREWGRTDLGDSGDAVLVELVGQAVAPTGVPDPSPNWAELDDLALIRVRLVLLQHGVIVEVSDRHDRPPVWPEVVMSLCTRWNSYPTAGGRVVWGEIPLQTYELTEHGLPKRVPSKPVGTSQPPASPADMELLRRVQEDLKNL